MTLTYSGNIFYITDHHHPHITFTSYHLSTISVHGVASKVSKEGDGQTDMAKAHYYRPNAVRFLHTLHKILKRYSSVDMQNYC